jgi:hypothetical protein
MDWKLITQDPPKDGEVVETKIDYQNGERNIQDLVKKGNLWFGPDMKMYVYYTPTHWRQKKPPND